MSSIWSDFSENSPELLAAARAQISGITQTIQTGGKCKHVHFKNGIMVPAFEP